jgi:hypothetical protein
MAIESYAEALAALVHRRGLERASKTLDTWARG